MGVLDSLLGGGEDPTTVSEPSTDQKYAILLNAGPDRPAVAGNGFNYAVDLAEAGYEVNVYLDGKATKWPAAFRDDPDRPFSTEWAQIRERGLLTGACGYCANAFDVAQSYEGTDAPLLSDGGEHAPAVAHLADEGFEILTIG